MYDIKKQNDMKTKSENGNSLADSVATPNVTLNNGVEMPILGFGVFQVPDPRLP